MEDSHEEPMHKNVTHWLAPQTTNLNTLEQGINKSWVVQRNGFS